jgi:hypothetical protein
VALHAAALGRPTLYCDDFQIVVRSWTWPAVERNLWVPANEHTMPLGRLSTWALIQLSGSQTTFPQVLVLQGPLAVAAGMLLLYCFVGRELAHPLYGLVAMAVFGVTTVYQQAIFWFSASFSVLSLDMTLLALLAAQRWRQTGSAWHLVGSAVWAALAPAWFAIGILAGPLCALYLLPSEPDREPKPETPEARQAIVRGAKRIAVRLLPLLGTAAFLAVSLPRTGEEILHLSHYEGKTAIEAFHPAVGLLNTCRSVVDNLLLGSFGISTPLNVVCPLPLVFAVLTLLVLAGIWWWRGAPQRRLLLLGLGCILTSYLLVYSARADGWSYARQVHAWSRYHLFPQLGVALFVTGGLPRWQGSRLQLDPEGRLTWQQARAVAVLIVALFVVQLPRGLIGAHAWTNPRQMPVLRHIQEMDARCRRLHIDRDTAREALEWLDIPGAEGRENGWELLWGSSQPCPVSVDEARRLLRGDDGPGSTNKEGASPRAGDSERLTRLAPALRRDFPGPASWKGRQSLGRVGSGPIVLSPRWTLPGRMPRWVRPPALRRPAGVPPTAPPEMPP